MSVEDITSVLLPASSVEFFLLDEGTSALVEKLKEDWRFSRVSINTSKAGIDAAISRYNDAKSPELIVVETNDLGEGFIKQLESLAGACSEGTDAVIIGPNNDIHLYRSLVEMGVKDYLVRPVSDKDMMKVIAKTLIDKRGYAGSRLITVIGSKGGVGTTAVSQIMAWNTAEVLKQKTMLMDAAGSTSSMGIVYGLESSSSLTEAVRFAQSGSEDDMKRIYQKASDKLSLLVCGSESAFNDIPEPDNIEALVNRIMQKYPVVIVDLSGTSRAVQKRLLALSAQVVVVTTPMISSLRNARALIGELKNIRSSLDEVDLVVNMKGMSSAEEVPMKDVKEALGIEPADVISYLPKIFVDSETLGKPVGENKLAEKVLKDLMSVAEKAVDVKRKSDSENKPETGGVSGFFKKLMSS